MKKLLTKKNLIYVLCSLIVVAIMASFTVLVAVPSVKKTAVKVAKENLYEKMYAFPEGAVVTAKNGFGDNENNSLLYVKSALQNSADCIEVDLCFSEDGTPYVASQNDEIGTNTMPLEYLVSYISDAIKSTQRQYKINLHLTDASNISLVDEIASRYDMEENCFFTGVNINQASYIRKNCKIKFYLDYKLDKSKSNNPDYISQIVNEISMSGAIGINCKADGFSELMMNMLKENWMKISFYDVETELEIIKALEFSPNQIITNNPQAVRSILLDWNKNAPSSDIIPS